MTADPNSPDVVERSKAFDEKLEVIGVPDLADLARSFRRLRATWKWMVTLWVVVVALVAFSVVEGVRANDAADKATRTQNGLHLTCVTGNQARSTESALWNYLLSVPPTTPPTPAEQAAVAQFKKFLSATLAPRDCTKLAGT